MAFYTGDTLITTFTVLDNDGSGVTSLTPTIDTSATKDPSGNTFAFTITEIGGGTYKATADDVATESGTYTIKINANDTDSQVFTDSWDVDGLTIATDSTITRKDLRRMVLRRFGDLHIATATANGTTTTFIDTDTLYGEPSRYAGRVALLTGGTSANLGKVRYVESYARSTNTLTFQSALPSATKDGDELELTNTFGMGVTFDQVHAAINYAILVSQPYALIPTTITASTAFDGSGENNTFEVPDTFTGVYAVQYLGPAACEEDKRWIPVNKAQAFQRNGWSIDRVAREVVIAGPWARQVNECIIRVYGYSRPAALTSDTSTTGVDTEWLVNEATSHLLFDVVKSRAGADWANQGLFYQQKNEQLRGRLAPVLAPSYEAF